MNSIEQLINQGWILEKRGFGNQYTLFPPKNVDPGNNWNEIKYNDIVITVPTWAIKDPRNKPPPGMPDRFGKRMLS